MVGDDEFFIELSDTSQQADIKETAEMLRRISVLYEANTVKTKANRELAAVAQKLMEAAISDDVVFELEKLKKSIEKKIQLSSNKKKKFFDAMKTQKELIVLENKNMQEKPFRKKWTIEKEKKVLQKLQKQGYRLRELAEYLNSKYKQEIHKNHMAPFDCSQIAKILKTV